MDRPFSAAGAPVFFDETAPRNPGPERPGGGFYPINLNRMVLK